MKRETKKARPELVRPTLEEARAKDLLLTRPQVSDWTQVPVGTLEGWAYKGTGPRYIRFGNGQVRYRPSDIEAWLQENYVSTSDYRPRPPKAR